MALKDYFEKRKEEAKSSRTSSAENKAAGLSHKNIVILSITGVLSVLALVMGMRLTVAAFSSNGFLKAVAATNEAANLLSSDLLATFGSEPGGKVPSKSIIAADSAPSDSEPMSQFSFSIFNYLQNDPGAWCQKDIAYDLKIDIEGSSDSSKCTVKYGGNSGVFSGSSIQVSRQTLAARRKSINTYTVIFPKSDLNTILFKVRATVTDSGGTTVRYLAADIAPSQEATVQATSVEMTSADRTLTNGPNDFDAYNYDVTLSGNQSRVTISWNDDLVQLEPYFEQKHPGAKINQTKHTVTLTMDPGTMRINFYRRAGMVTIGTQWDDLNIRAAVENA